MTSGGAAVEGVLTQGNRIVAEIDAAIGGIVSVGKVISESKAKIIEKAAGGAEEAAKDFATLAKFADRVVTKGAVKIAELKNGLRAVLRNSTHDGRPTLEIQRRTVMKGSGKDIKIRMEQNNIRGIEDARTLARTRTLTNSTVEETKFRFDNLR